MTGSALMDFLIGMVILFGVAYMFFLAIDKIGPDEFFKKIANTAIGIVAFVAVLVAGKGVLFGGGGPALSASPIGLIEFAIGLLVVLLVIYLLYMAVDFFVPQFAVQLKYLIGAIALIALLVLAGRALFGGGLGMIPANTFRLR